MFTLWTIPLLPRKMSSKINVLLALYPYFSIPWQAKLEEEEVVVLFTWSQVHPAQMTSKLSQHFLLSVMWSIRRPFSIANSFSIPIHNDTGQDTLLEVVSPYRNGIQVSHLYSDPSMSAHPFLLSQAPRQDDSLVHLPLLALADGTCRWGRVNLCGIMPPSFNRIGACVLRGEAGAELDSFFHPSISPSLPPSLHSFTSLPYTKG